MFLLDNAPIFGQQHPELYDEAFKDIRRNTASTTAIATAVKYFLDTKVPHYFARATSPQLAYEMGVTNCIGRALVVHTLLSPFTQLKPFIELQRTSTRIHASNPVVYGGDTSVLTFDSSYKESYIPDHLSADEVVHDATTSVSWGVNPLLPLNYEERHRVEQTVLHPKDTSGFITTEAEQELTIPFYRDEKTVVLLGQRAGNLIVDAVSGAVRSDEHHQIIQNFKAFCASGVSA